MHKSYVIHLEGIMQTSEKTTIQKENNSTLVHNLLTLINHFTWFVERKFAFCSNEFRIILYYFGKEFYCREEAVKYCVHYKIYSRPGKRNKYLLLIFATLCVIELINIMNN